MLNSPLASGMPAFAICPSASRVGGRMQNITAKPRTTCGQNIWSIVRRAGLDAAHRQADAENEKSECRQIALVVTLLQRGRERSGHKLHDAGHQNDEADFEARRVP